MPRAVRAQIKPLIVPPEGLPGLYDVCDIISHDCGARAGHKGYLLPDVMPLTARQWSGLLSSLTDNELHAFAVGEQSEVDEITRRVPQLAACNRALNRWFEMGAPCACSQM